MAEVVPFRAVRYDLSRAGAADSLIAPPYDVISESDRSELEAKSPFNIVRVDLPQGDRERKYRNAAGELRRWLEEGILRRDDAPALYRYHQVFSVGGRDNTRKCFICRIRLRRFDERVVLPHERTLSGPRLDRLELARACRMHLSQVFGLYSDPGRTVDREFDRVDSGAPELEAHLGGTVHRVWRLMDAGAHQRIAAAMADRKVYIADGHHRYETMLAIEQTLGIDRAAQEQQTNLRYVKDFDAALEESRRPDVQAAFLLNPTRISQLRAVADAGEVMPQKSTFFFPKLASGLVLDPID